MSQSPERFSAAPCAAEREKPGVTPRTAAARSSRAPRPAHRATQFPRAETGERATETRRADADIQPTPASESKITDARARALAEATRTIRLIRVEEMA